MAEIDTGIDWAKLDRQVFGNGELPFGADMLTDTGSAGTNRRLGDLACALQRGTKVDDVIVTTDGNDKDNGLPFTGAQSDELSSLA